MPANDILNPEIAMQEGLIVIVPGSRTKVCRFRLLNNYLEQFYGHLGVKMENDERWTNELRQLLITKQTSAEVLIFNWSGGVTKTFSLNRAAQDLLSIISQKPYKKVALLCKSLGGIVGEIAARRYGRRIKLIEIATPHSPFQQRIPEAEIVNIYSPQDRYVKLCNRLLYFGSGRNTVARAYNIALPNVGHSMFNENVEVHYCGKRIKLFELYNELLTSSSWETNASKTN